MKGNIIKVEWKLEGRAPLTHYVSCRKSCQLQTPTEESSAGNHKLQTPRGNDVHGIPCKKLTPSATLPMLKAN